MDYLRRAREVMDVEMAGLKKVRDNLGPEFGRAVDILIRGLAAGGKIIVTGVGKNLPIGQKIASTLTSTGATSLVMHPQEALHGDLGLLGKEDVVLALSYSGESDELVNLLPLLKRRELPIIAITGRRDSMLAGSSEVVLVAAVEREACPFNLAPTASTTATLALGDALAMVLLEARGFRKEDFATLHPAGAIGRALLLRAADIMRKGERVARVKQGATMQEAILAMTSARSGSVAVLDEQDRVLGIVTDGDLRRHLAEGTDIRQLAVEKVMTVKPVMVRDSHLAAEVLAIYEKHNIDDLLVTDGEGRLLGMIDIQDLPKMKIL